MPAKITLGDIKPRAKYITECGDYVVKLTETDSGKSPNTGTFCAAKLEILMSEPYQGSKPHKVGEVLSWFKPVQGKGGYDPTTDIVEMIAAFEKCDPTDVDDKAATLFFDNASAPAKAAVGKTAILHVRSKTTKAGKAITVATFEPVAD